MSSGFGFMKESPNAARLVVPITSWSPMSFLTSLYIALAVLPGILGHRTPTCSQSATCGVIYLFQLISLIKSCCDRRSLYCLFELIVSLPGISWALFLGERSSAQGMD